MHVCDGKGLDISHIGHTTLHSLKRIFTLSNVLHVPYIIKPLLSVQKFYRDNYVYLKFYASVFYVKDLITKEVLLSGQSNDGLYVLFKHLFSYLKGTTTHDLHITRSSSFALLGFTDANWAGSIADKKSTGDYPVFFGQTLISWKSGKQRTVAHSSTEAEYKALADGTAEVIWLRYLLTYL